MEYKHQILEDFILDYFKRENLNQETLRQPETGRYKTSKEAITVNAELHITIKMKTIDIVNWELF